VDISGSQAMNNAGYTGFKKAVFDGRYIYFVPYNNGSATGYLARYDTRGALTQPSSWTGVDLTSTSALGSANYVSFEGGIYDGRYIYLVPNNTGGYLARYDSKGSLTSSSSWTGVSIASSQILNSSNFQNFQTSQYDGRYIYFAQGSGYLARYDTKKSLNDSTAWNGINLTSSSFLNNGCYSNFVGAVFDGRYMYFVPAYNGSYIGTGCLARFDTVGSFSSGAHWSGIDITSSLATNNPNAYGFSGGIFDGRYIYFVGSTHGGGGPSGVFARYDTLSPLNSPASWTSTDIASASMLNNTQLRGWVGATSDGRYIYAPTSWNGVHLGYAARYDMLGTSGSFILKYSDSVSDGYDSSAPGPTFTINTTTGPITVQSQSSLTAGTWHHIAATYDGATAMSFYIDGQLVATQPASGDINVSTSNVSIGALSYGGGYFNGLIDDVQIYSQALSAGQVQSLYQSRVLWCH